MKARARVATYAGYRTRTLEVDGIGPRIVLLHGYADSAETWTDVLDEFGKVGRSAIAVDLPGFGRADPLRPGEMLPQFDAFVADLVREQGSLGDVVLVGNSLGGVVTVRAACAPVRLLGAVTIGDPMAGPWPLRSLAETTLGALLLRVLGVAIPSLGIRAPSRFVLRLLVYADRRRADPRVIDRFVLWFQTGGGHRARLRQIRNLIPEIRGGHGPIEPQVPLLIVHGAKDRIVPVRGSQAFHAATPGSELFIGRGWGHCPQLDDPEALAGLVGRFVDTWSAESGRRLPTEA